MKKRRISTKLLALFLSCSMLTWALVGCGDSGVEDESPIKTEESTETSNKEYTHRIIVMSDPHYMTNDSQVTYNTNHPGENAAPSAGDAFGYTQTEKMSAILTDVNKFAERENVEGVLVLGDLGTDDYGFRNLSENYVQKFKEEVMAKFPGVSYALPGNHDTYPNDMWNEIFGYDRQYSVKIGDAAFIMLDTYADLSTVDASGSRYTGIDVDWLEKELEKYPTEQIFLCCHYLGSQEENYKLNKILRENERIVCVFRGHTHLNEILVCNNLNNEFMFDLGGYAYMGEKTAAGYDYSVYDNSWAWGFGVLEWNDTEAHYYHVKFDRTYTGSNGIFNYAGAIEDDMIIKFDK